MLTKKNNTNNRSATFATIRNTFIYNILVLVLGISHIERLHAEKIFENPIPYKIQAHSSDLQVTEIASGFTAPVAGTTAPMKELSDFIFIADQVGFIWRINLKNGGKTIFIDLRSRIIELGAFNPGGYDERGLLNLAFHPNYKKNGLLYVFTSEATSGNADFSTLKNPEQANHQSVILELTIDNPIASEATIEKQRVLLKIDQPQYNHNGGSLAFDSNNFLYIGLGDGGKSDDQGPGHGEHGNSGDLSNPLGAILRIDPLGNNAANEQYGIPTDNPFINKTDSLDEIFAYGFRNPWKMSFDNSGNLFVADVGQNHIEEINLVTKGGHYGWPIREGKFWFDNNGRGRGFVSNEKPKNQSKRSYKDPILQYDHDEGISITGGYVYEGSAIKELNNKYIFADFRSRVFIANTEERTIHVSNIKPDILLFSFALDHDGEIYFMGNEDANTKGHSGKLYKIIKVEKEVETKK